MNTQNFMINVTLCGIYDPVQLRLLNCDEVKEIFFDSKSKVDLQKDCYLLYIEFDCDNKEIDWFVLTTNEDSYDPDYQHTSRKNQRDFYFRLTERLPFESLRINGLKSIPTNIPKPMTKLIGRSDVISNFMGINN